ncbi:MAG TPA: ribosomal L7Ae/L30e/S12e/Gadd45 family protein [Candidatus Scatovivens faecipullorum]|nr:ribosomal L7Ae/L30e/S12e/Gadd45 family protein [Candidatus Scatovivens faecipullorum]
MINKVYGLLGISSKAGKVISGTDIILEKMERKKVKLVIIAEDASEKTIKNMKYYCNKENVELIIYGNILENSKAIGKHNRATIAIIDQNLAIAIKKLIHGGE